MKIISNKKYEQLLQIKGYYDGNNADNEYFKQIAAQLVGLRLPGIAGLGREEIKKAYETIAPVNGVVDYIADNVGEVMRYLELRKLKPDGSFDYVDSHWLLDILRKPNDRYNLRRFGKAWAVNRLLFGDAWVYAPMTAGKDRKINPKIGMYVLPGQKIAVEAGGLNKPIKGIKLIGTTGDDNRGTVPSLSLADSLEGLSVVGAHSNLSDINITVGGGNHAEVLLADALTLSSELSDSTERSSLGSLTTGVGVHLSIEHEDVHIFAGSDDVVETAVTDVVGSTVATDDPL